MKRVSVPILFLTVLLLLSVAFARQLGEKEYDKHADVKDADYHVDQWGGGPGWGGRPGWGGGPGWGRPGWGGGPGWGRPGWGGCRYRCYYGRCCSAAEFAEFVQSQGVPQN
ncbi:uncharacterized protein LOC116257964 [Nymphaea colorata]|nr:uncharacterized protein LOC116257964 [Nymphaea colorata]